MAGHVSHIKADRIIPTYVWAYRTHSFQRHSFQRHSFQRDTHHRRITRPNGTHAMAGSHGKRILTQKMSAELPNGLSAIAPQPDWTPTFQVTGRTRPNGTHIMAGSHGKRMLTQKMSAELPNGLSAIAPIPIDTHIPSHGAREQPSSGRHLSKRTHTIGGWDGERIPTQKTRAELPNGLSAIAPIPIRDPYSKARGREGNPHSEARRRLWFTRSRPIAHRAFSECLWHNVRHLPDAAGGQVQDAAYGQRRQSRPELQEPDP